MTRPSQRASSERHAPRRSEPATALPAIRPTRKIALSIPTLRLHCPMFHRKEISEYRRVARATMASLPGVAISPVVAPGTTAIFKHQAFPRAGKEA